MKKIAFLLLATGLTACSQNTPKETAATGLSFYGDTITEDQATETAQLATLMGSQDRMQVKLTGTIDEVCQKKGCWMDVNMGENQTLRVRFKDYGFFVPKDAAGKTVVMDALAFHDTVTVAELRHYAEDAGKSKE